MNAKFTKKHPSNRTDVAKLRKKDDKDINYKDSPATTKKFWKNAEIFIPKNKAPISR